LEGITDQKTYSAELEASKEADWYASAVLNKLSNQIVSVGQSMNAAVIGCRVRSTAGLTACDGGSGRDGGRWVLISSRNN